MSQCQHINIDYDDRNVRVCADCGEILDVHQLVNTYSYGEGAHGAYLEGQFMQINGIQAANSASRQATIQKFQRHFKYVAEMLQLSDSLIQHARKLYEAALEKQITQARKSNHVAAVLLAIACMQEGLPYLLIDFANIFQVNISELSSTFLDFTEKLSINIPVQRPEVFVDRFCEQVYSDIQDGRFDCDLNGTQFEPSKTFTKEQKLQMIKDVKHLVHIMQELGIHVQKKPQLVVGTAIYLILHFRGVYCCTQQICDYIFMSKDALDKTIKAALSNEYFKTTPVEAILAEKDIKYAVQEFKTLRPINYIKRSQLTTEDGQNPDGYHTAQFMDARPFTYFENGYIYEMPALSKKVKESIPRDTRKQDNEKTAEASIDNEANIVKLDTDLEALKELDAEVNLYLSDTRQVKAREELFEKLYKDEMLYYIERRKLKKVQGARRRRRFHTLEASLESVQQLPKDTKAQLTEVLRLSTYQNEENDLHEQIPQFHTISYLKAQNEGQNIEKHQAADQPEESHDLYEEESQDGQQILLV